MNNSNLKKYCCYCVVHHACTRIPVAILFAWLVASSASAQMVHPGGWHTQDDLATIREKIAAEEEPWITGWNAARNEGPDANFVSNPTTRVTGRSAVHTAGFAAWVLTMKWVASGDRSFSDAAINIIDTWVETVEEVDVSEPSLRVSTGAGAMAQAAEILAHGFNGEAGWPQQNVAAAQVWFRNVIYDPQTNTGLLSSSNFGTSALGGNTSMAIFMDDEEAYSFQRQAFITGYNLEDGCNSLTDYIPFATGQAFETGRDQVHVQGGIAHLTEAALCLWNQGDPFVYLENNRLLAGVEYHARYNLGFDDLPPYDPDIPNRCNISVPGLNATEISDEFRGEFSPVYYMSAKLFSKAGLNHPNTRAVFDFPGYSPEINNFAHPGLGMFTFVSPTPQDIAVNITVPAGRGDRDAAIGTAADFISQNPGCNLDANTVVHTSEGVGRDSNLGDNFAMGVAVGGFTVTTTQSDPLGAPVTNEGFNAGDTSYNDTDPITEGYAFDTDNTKVVIDGLLTNSALGDTLTLSIWGIGDNIGQQAEFVATYGSHTAIEGNTQETRYNGPGEARGSAVGSIPFVNFTFVADGVTDQISFDIHSSTGGRFTPLNAFSLSVTEPSSGLLGDFNLDGVVNCADLDGYVGNIGAPADGALAALDMDGNGTLDASDANTLITTLIETSNGAVGTFPGDLNCDGTVNVLGDAFALIGSLGTTVTMYSQGDINFDGQVNVLGDAFILIGNLNRSNQ